MKIALWIFAALFFVLAIGTGALVSLANMMSDADIDAPYWPVALLFGIAIALAVTALKLP